MSRMPAKKKSCFQITSVTTAQAAAGAAEDAESLDDPDESRTEDASSDLFDASRATDYGADGGCERSSSEETLSTAGDADAPAAASPPPARAAPAAPPPAAGASRFRVIKLDHGSGEPYRRGRWTCSDFYERDADPARSADCIRHGGAPEPAAERDSGLGATGGSAAGPRAPDSGPDGAPPPAPDKVSPPAPAPPPAGPGQPQGPGAQGPPPAAAPRPPPFAHPQAQPAPGHPLPAQPRVQGEFLQPLAPAAAAFAAVGAQPAGASPPPPEPGALGAPVGRPAGGAGQPQPAPQMGGGQLPAAPAGPRAPVPGAPNVPSAPAACAAAPGPAPPAGRSSGAGQQRAGPAAHHAPTSLPQSDLSHFQTQTQPAAGPVDETRRKSEPLPQPPPALLAENTPAGKAADALANPLQLTPMNSLATSVFSIAIPVDGDEDRNPSTAFYQAFHLNTFQESKSLWDSASGGGVVAIDNKIEQAMDLVKSHLMYAVREEVEVLKEQIKELVERNSLLERENALLKSLSNNDQLSQLPAQQASPGSTSQQQAVIAQPQPPQPPQQPNVSSA